MKAVNYILGLCLTFLLQSCFQDFKEPAFNYPEGKPDPDMENFNPEKLKLTFDTGRVEDESTYQFMISAVGNGTVVKDAGIIGNAYQGADESYLLVNPHEAIKEAMVDTLSHLKEFTFATWLNCSKNSGATMLFSISNSETFWGNLDLFFDNNNSDTEALLKAHIYNGDKENWSEVRIPDFFTNTWHHLAVTYNGEDAVLSVWVNGEKILNKVLDHGGELRFNNMSSIVIGTPQFQTVPSLTTGAGKQDWAGYYKGLLDGVHFYNKELSSEEVAHLFSNKL